MRTSDSITFIPQSQIRNLQWGREHQNLIADTEGYPKKQRLLRKKGGDPAAASATATLLRLHPNYQPYLRSLPPLRLAQGLAQPLRVEPTFVV